MNPDNGLVFVLLFNNKLLEINPKPSAHFLLQNYGKKSRVLKISPALGRPIALDFHRGHLLLATNNSLCGWNIQKELNPQLISEAALLSGTDFKLDHNLNFDHNYLRIIKQPGRVCLIGNEVMNGVYFRWRDPTSKATQRLVWVSDGSQRLQAAPQAGWAIYNTQ